jgi:pyruvate/2-oxoglutarate dehydrogenase complex dihydrolipoamide dehydrogenase (E3) component
MIAYGERLCYCKVIVHKFDSNRVIGYHICCPNAGEITQGVAMAIKCGMTKEQMDSTVGIHPTAAEDSIGLEFTKEEHGDYVKSSC